MTPSTGWFCALLDSAADVYFRYALSPTRRLVYVSPSVHALTGHAPEAFYGDPNFCLSLIPSADRRLLRQVLRSRRGRTLGIRFVRHGVEIPIELRTVALVRHRRVVAIEGVARLTIGMPAARGVEAAPEPTQQRLAALMVEVHELLHRVLPHGAPDLQVRDISARARSLRLGDLSLDLDRMIVTESGVVVSLTSREVMVLRYLLQHPGRVVTRRNLLEDVWSYTYTGDDRTVDVHISRLRRKLPSLRGRLVAIRHVGYRLDADEAAEESRLTLRGAPGRQAGSRRIANS
ncbi:MAG: winged helix-turn-helix domain-containing protein [Acidobacteriota bacterium]